MKSEKELARAELEVGCINEALSMLRYLGFNPKSETWKAHCRAMGYYLSSALTRAEWCQAHPNHKWG